MIGHLAPLEQHVQRHDRRAGLEDAEVDDREVRQVRARQRDLVAGLDAAGHQQVRDLVRSAVDLRIRQTGVAEHDRRTVGILLGRLLQQGGEIGHGDSSRGDGALTIPGVSGSAGQPFRPATHLHPHSSADRGGRMTARFARLTRDHRRVGCHGRPGRRRHRCGDHHGDRRDRDRHHLRHGLRPGRLSRCRRHDQGLRVRGSVRRHRDDRRRRPLLGSTAWPPTATTSTATR